jgi:uncharacterized protein (TIGR03435 family)
MKIFALAALAASCAFAQDVTGIWQGTIQTPQANLRMLFKIEKADQGLKATAYSIDQSSQGFGGTVTVQAAAVKITLPGIGGAYDGKLDADAAIMTGNWVQGQAQLPLNLRRVKAEEAWPIPDAPKVKAMAPDATLAFEVASIKPSEPGVQGHGITMRGPKELATINTSLDDLMTFAYGIHLRQISGAPAWAESERYNITAKPAADGMPNRQQIEGMLQKLLADRFKLTFHRDKKELSVYAVTVAKGGSKMAATTADANALPGLGLRGLGDLVARNANMSDFAALLQSTVLDRPVVDQTGLKGRFDFTLRWTPDEFQFASLSAGIPRPAADAPDAPPPLNAAVENQLGLKIDSAKATVETLVIDHVEKPSDN